MNDPKDSLKDPQKIKLQLQDYVRIKLKKLPSKQLIAAKEGLKIEAENAKLLNHPNIMKSFEIGETNNQIILYQKRYRQHTALANPNVSIGQKLHIMAGFATGIHSMHLKKIAHLDVKPANMLIEGDPTGETLAKGVVADIGLMRDFKDSHKSGSPFYVSPQIWKGLGSKKGAPVDPKDDSYALGVSLYAVITNQLESENLKHLMNLDRLRKIAKSGDAKRHNTLISNHINTIMEEMEIDNSAAIDALQICKNLLSFNPEDRMSCDEVAAALEKIRVKYS